MKQSPPHSSHLYTLDGRYLIVRGRLWRTANPHLPADERQQYVNELMHARRAVGTALKSKDNAALKAARAAVQSAKEKLGERGPVWWPVIDENNDRDFTRTLARNSPYAEWFSRLPASSDQTSGKTSAKPYV